MTVLLIALGAAVGAPARCLTDRALQARHDSVFPWGTFIVNVTGSFLLGIVAGFAAGEDLDPWPPPSAPGSAVPCRPTARSATRHCGWSTMAPVSRQLSMWSAGIVAGLGAVGVGWLWGTAVT